MIRRLALAVLLTAPGMAAADPFCSQLEPFMGDGTPPGLGIGNTPDCGTTLVLGGGSSVHCAWRFDLRSPQATRTFAETGFRLEQCGATPIKETTTQVNHPDSYDQRTFTLRDMRLSLSLKDKGGLGATLVFLRAEPNAQE